MPRELERWLKKYKNRIIVVGILLVAVEVFVYWQIFAADFQNQNLRLYFLDVGQGDSEFIELPGGVQILIDGGPPNGKILEELGEILPAHDRYLDLVIVSHPQLDHFAGLVEVLKRYRVGLLIHNGRSGLASPFNALKEAIGENNVKTLRLAAGDEIRYLDSIINILSPDSTLVGDRELNDTSLVLELNSKNTKSLFTGDIGPKAENYLTNLLTYEVNILKVAHHGSKFSSSANFLNAVRPELAIIEVGKNSYGHPTPETLSRLNAVGAKIYRTDQDGTVKLVIDGENIKIIK